MSAMNIGICKTALLSGLMGIFLSACTGGVGFSGFGQGKVAREAPIFSTQAVKMIGGNVSLVPPAGYCIDSDSLTRKFAVMLPCATNGHSDMTGMLTISLAKNRKAGLSASDLANAENAKTAKTSQFKQIEYVESNVPASLNLPMRKKLRTVTNVNGIEMSLALYTEQDEYDFSQKDHVFLYQFIWQTKRNSVQGR